MQPSSQLLTRAEAIGALIAGMSPDQVDAPTPCADWDVRGLLNHLVGAAHLYGSVFAGQAPAASEEHPGDLIGSDPAGAWAGACAVFIAGVDSPGALERPIPTPVGALPGAVMLEVLKFDLLVHAWDLARATGQSFDPPASAVEESMQVARMLISSEMRDGGMFAAEVVPGADASAIDRLAAFSGRQP